MPSFGPFTTVQELHRTPFGAVFSAQRDGAGAAAFAVKVCRPEPVIVGEAEAADIVARFVASARAQRDAAGPGLLAIHDIGELAATEDQPSGAYSVTDLAVRGSCERLLVGASSVDARSLSNIIRHVTEALVGLKQRGGRPHGNLDPRNVLLMDEAPLASVRVALTDIAPNERVVGDGAWTADTRAIGELVYRLVMRRGYAGGWPVVDSPEWQRLGRGAGGGAGLWRELCNRLLSPATTTDSAAAITIEQLPGLIPSPNAGVGSRRKRNLMIAAAVVVLVGGGVSWKLLQHQEPPPTFALIGADPAAGTEAEARWNELVAAYFPRQGWLDPFVQAIEPDRKIREGEAEGIAALKRWCPDLLERARPLAAAESKPPRIAGRGEDAGVFWEDPSPGDLSELGRLLRDPGSRSLEKYRYMGDAAIARAREVVAEVDRFRAFVADEWAPLKGVAAAQERFAGQGWNNAAAHLGAMTDRLKYALANPAAAGSGEVESGSVAAMAVQIAQAVPAVAEIEKSSGELVATADAIKAGDDPVLSKLAAALPALVQQEAGAAEGRESLTALGRGIEATAKLVADVGGYASADRKPAVDRPELARLIAERKLAAAPPSAVTFRTWLTLADSALMAGEHPAVRLVTDAGEADRLVQTYAATPSIKSELQTSFADELAALRSEVDGLSKRSYVSGTKADVDRISDGLAGRMSRLTASVKAETAAAIERERAGLEAMRNELRTAAEWGDILSSSAVNAEWRRRREVMTDLPGQTVAALDAERRRVRGLLQRLDEGVAAAPTAAAADGRWGELLAEAAAGARDQAMAVSLGKLAGSALTEAEVMSAAAEASRASEAWLTKAAALKADMSRVTRLLNTEFSLAAKGEDGRSAKAIWTRWQGDEFVREASVARALEPLASRVAAHQRVADERSPETLLAVIKGVGDDGFAEAVGAWEKLTGDSASGGLAWPRVPDDLKTAAEAAGRVRQLVEQGAGDASVRAAAVRRVQDRAVASWTGFARRQVEGGEGVGDVKARERAFRAALGQIEAFGVNPDGIADPSVRVNVLLAGFAAGVTDATDDAVRQSAATLRSKLESVSGLVDPRLAVVLNEVRTRIETPPKVTPVEQLGPGAKGFATRGPFEGGRITFTIAEGQDLTFVAVDRPEGTVFLAEQEASLDLLRAIIEKAGLSHGDVVNNGWLGDRPERAEKPDEEWSGPRVWKWSRSAGGYKLAAGGAWYDTRGNPLQKFQTNPAYPDIVIDRQKRPDPGVIRLPAGMGDEPSGAMPMQRITPRGALEACEVIGCRLPTESEWRAGLAMLPQPAAAPVFNLRDQTFKRLEDYIRPLRDGGTVSLDFHRLPDEGSYDYTDEKLGGSHPFSDGFVWFWPVTAGPGSQAIRNMVGNVGEIVMTDTRTGFAAIGGSALSRIENPIDRAVPIDESASFWDVGFRPSFSSKDRVPEPLRVQARQILTERLGETMLLMK